MHLPTSVWNLRILQRIIPQLSYNSLAHPRVFGVLDSGQGVYVDAASNIVSYFGFQMFFVAYPAVLGLIGV